MSAMTAGTSQPATSVPPWNPNKPAAPNPPAGQEAQTSVSTQSRQATSTSNNYPDVTVGTRDFYEADQGNQSTRSAGNSSDHSVVPDYPLDSLPRNATRQSVSANETLTQQSEPRTSQARTSHSTSGSRSNQRTSSSSVPGSSAPVIVSTASMPPSQTVPLRVSGEVAPHGARLPRQSSQPIGLPHSNVSVNINHGIPHQSSSEHRQVRTQDLSVGVAARLDHHAHSSGMLPDLVAHSQPQSSSRLPANLPRNAIPVPLDPRYSQGHRHHDPHSRHRQHRDYRYSRSHRHTRRRTHSEDDDAPCKETCLKCIAVGTSFRWILVVLSLLGVCCVVTGIILAALHAAGNSFLFLAIMFIGLGVLLVVVVGVGWKCTPRGHEPLHALFRIGDFRQQSRSSRRQRSRHRRDGRWHGGVMYPEFQFPRPPPTYDASMREYQQQQQIAQAQQNQTPDLYDPDDIPIEDYSLPSSPPPSYRSRASTVRAGIQITFPPNQGGDFPDSRPPTYRSHPSNTLPGHGRTRPSLSRDEDEGDDVDQAPADVAFTGSSVVVDTNSNQNTTSIQIGSAGVQNQNVTVSVTTVSVTTQSATSNSQATPLAALNGVEAVGPGIGVYTVTASPVEGHDVVDPVGDVEEDRVDTAL